MTINSPTIRISNYWEETANEIQTDIAALSCTVNEKVDAVRNTFDELACRVAVLEANFNELEYKLRPVLDAKPEKPKQKWLWEIFEPNDIGIDFPYNL